MPLCRTSKPTDFRKPWQKLPEISPRKGGWELEGARPVGTRFRANSEGTRMSATVRNAE
jgi:hypothetical protein